ncbi:NADAR family protein [Oricola sp.]|uniref:NADAR family protein n=1 Tax=Oricola sp. TaxID=1979950 RepID=UPI00351928A4|tara:strand:- start:39 stop:524 length:486 start_codon:yes stop_codon:yes gene_type:complete
MPAAYPPDTVYFYAQTDTYSEFSNFAPYGIAMDDVWWRTVEHYFQAQKFHDAAYRERIRLSNKPKDAKALGMTRAIPLRPDWEEVKDGIMLEAVTVKFETHAELAELLLSTGDRQIVENAPMDSYWGCGPDGTGLNKLGRMLMEVREKLRSEAPASAQTPR